jgi:hypothetical protein
MKISVIAGWYNTGESDNKMEEMSEWRRLHKIM